MYLHIGNDYSVDIRDIIGIFDMDNTTVTGTTKEKLCIYTTYELPKSFIITEKKGRVRVYISQLAASTLKKRLSQGEYL